MKTGAEPKKVAVLCGFLLIAAITLYINVFSGDSPTPSPRPAAATTANPAPIVAPRTTPDRRRTAKNTAVGEWKPRQGAANPEDRLDPATIDPTLRLDLLAKVQTVQPEPSMRNIFQYGAAPPPPAPAKPIELPKAPPKIAINQPPATAPPPGPPPPPQAPPMTFKYYGYKVSKSDGRKEAFLLDGDDIIIAGESDPVKRGRYKVVRIGVNSITMEDTQFKSTQTLQLQEDPAA
jgi:hypothetical protein